MGRSRANSRIEPETASPPERRPPVTDREFSELSEARQRAQDLLLRARLEGRSSRSIAIARERAQRAANALLAARLDRERGIRMVSASGRRLAPL
jgi:hypothetical protein